MRSGRLDLLFFQAPQSPTTILSAESTVIIVYSGAVVGKSGASVDGMPYHRSMGRYTPDINTHAVSPAPAIQNPVAT